MKNLNHAFKELKRIAPESEYAASSRARILATRRSARRVTARGIFRNAGAFAMAGLAVIGGISLVRSALPVPAAPLAPLDQQALSAEAGAIDAQLALADVQYQAVAEELKDSQRAISTVAANVAKSAAGTQGDGEVDRALLALSE